MYRLSEELAKLIMSKIKPPVIESEGEESFLPKTKNSIGIADPICCVGSDFHYLLESPVPVIYQDYPFVPVGVQGYFLYRREELLQPMESWMINEILINPTSTDPESQIDASDCAVILPDDMSKLTAKTISSFKRLIELEPLLLDCISSEK